MILYTDNGIETAINKINDLQAKLANMIPADGFDREDIRATMLYLSHYRAEVEAEKRRRARRAGSK